MKISLSLMLLPVVLVSGTVAEATICTQDQVPAATLLFPFVVADYENFMDGQNTVIGITNTGPAAQIVHVRIWSDGGTPVLGFNIVLSGYDVQRIDLRRVLFWGELPVTGTSGAQLVTGSTSEAGPVDGSPDLRPPSGTGTVANRCRAAWPGYPAYPQIPPHLLALMQSYLQVSQVVDKGHNDCISSDSYLVGDWFENRDHEDLTWMYVTADVVWTCTRLLPGDAAYWQDGPANNPERDPAGAQLMRDNVLMGDVQWVNPTVGLSESGLAVHIEATSYLGDTLTGGPVSNPDSGLPQSFYHHWSAPHGQLDGREPMPTGWAFRYIHDGAVLSTRVRAWKAHNSTPDLIHNSTVTGLMDDPWVMPTLDIDPEMYARDCLAYTYYAWDEDENVTTGGIEPNLIPLATQEFSVDQLSLVDTEGWILVLWPRSNTDQADLYQTWMGTGHEIFFGNLSMAMPATAMRNFNCGW